MINFPILNYVGMGHRLCWQAKPASPFYTITFDAHLMAMPFTFMWLWVYILIFFSADLELGFLEEIYTISEESGLNNAMICAVINSGILEREVVVNISVTDITTEGIAKVHSYTVKCYCAVWKHN